MEHHAATIDQTRSIAADLAANLNPGDVILLHGTLGMGKSVFARSLIRTLCKDQTLEVPSPTFTLVQIYDGQNAPIYHFDLYRLQDPEEIFELGWDDALAEGITILEWPERLGPYTPQKAPQKSNARILDITLQSVENDDNARQILIEERS